MHFEYVPISRETVNDFKKLNLALFPVRYNVKFYEKAVDLGPLGRLAYACSDTGSRECIGAVCCRIDDSFASFPRKSSEWLEDGASCSTSPPSVSPISLKAYEEPVTPPSSAKLPKSGYIMTLGVLSSFRSMGVGSCLLDYLQESARKEGLQQLQLHVQTSNTEAVQFYLKRNFVILDFIPDYYRRISVTSAYLLHLDL